MARVDWQGAKEWLHRTFVDVTPDEPGYAEDAVHGPILVTPMHPDHPDRPYRVESPSLGVLELYAEHLTVRGPGFVGRIRPNTASFRRGSEDVRVDWDGHELHLKHTRAKKAKLRLDRTTVAVLVAHSARIPGRDQGRVTYDIRWEQPVPGSVVLLGHALASRYGVGAEGGLTKLALDLG